jgi:hypothetical protein
LAEWIASISPFRKQFIIKSHYEPEPYMEN